MANDIHQGFSRSLTLSYTQADGTPGIVEGVPVWEITPVETSTLVVADDGMSGTIAWAGTGDGAILTVTADGDLGTGVFPIVVTETFNFVAPLGAVSGMVSIGEEVPVV